MENSILHEKRYLKGSEEEISKEACVLLGQAIGEHAGNKISLELAPIYEGVFLLIIKIHGSSN